MTEEKTIKMNKLTVEQFCDILASFEPIPGGGSVAALCGALSSALSHMVTGLTLGREKYRDVWETLSPLEAESKRLIKQLLSLTEEDTAAYLKVSKAYKLPRTSAEEKEKRRKALQEALKEATRVPLETLKTMVRVMEMAEKVTSLGNRNARSDAAAAVHIAHAAATIASYNVRINIADIEDKTFVERCKEEERSAFIRIKESYKNVEKTLIEYFGNVI
ncbi:MAG: methenyltetrahydrofolate cyclohydrolase [Spirochaetes bacterium]|nr:MAG: methenyltetrahydrofolate cyclohydrolase [Spirochaetota bacterium]